MFLPLFLNFIPNLGFIIALIPPTLVALLMLGWKSALVVGGGMIVTNLIVDNVVTPMLVKNAMEISLLEITLSLLFWGYVLGPLGAVLSVPLTMVLKKIIAERPVQDEPAVA